MRLNLKGMVWFGGVGLALIITILSPLLVFAQWPFSAPITPDAQRNALAAVRSQVNWLVNATRTAPSNVSGGYGNVWQQFQALRAAYTGLTQTLNPQQVAQGANDFAELNAGLDIIQEAFTNCQEAVNAGQNQTAALRDMCQILRQATQVWLQEFNSRCVKLRVGWG